MNNNIAKDIVQELLSDNKKPVVPNRTTRYGMVVVKTSGGLALATALGSFVILVGTEFQPDVQISYDKIEQIAEEFKKVNKSAEAMAAQEKIAEERAKINEKQRYARGLGWTALGSAGVLALSGAGVYVNNAARRIAAERARRTRLQHNR